MTTIEIVTCLACNNSGPLSDIGSWHGYRHEIQLTAGRGLVVTHKDDEPQLKQSSMPFDPVLRQALVDKGVLTVEDLRAAEEKIRAISGMFNQEVTRGADHQANAKNAGYDEHARQPDRTTERLRSSDT
jgi:hypothetical protein